MNQYKWHFHLTQLGPIHKHSTNSTNHLEYTIIEYDIYRKYSWINVINKLQRRPTLLITLHIPPPLHDHWCGRLFRWSQFFWSKASHQRLLELLKIWIFIHLSCIWCLHLEWLHLNLNKIFGIKRVPGLSYGTVCIIKQLAVQFWYNTEPQHILC